MCLACGAKLNLPETPTQVGGYDAAFMLHWQNSAWIHSSLYVEADAATEAPAEVDAWPYPNIVTPDVPGTRIPLFAESIDQSNIMMLSLFSGQDKNKALNYWMSNDNPAHWDRDLRKFATLTESNRNDILNDVREGIVYSISKTATGQVKPSWRDIDHTFALDDSGSIDQEDLMAALTDGHRARLGNKQLQTCLLYTSPSPRD